MNRNTRYVVGLTTAAVIASAGAYVWCRTRSPSLISRAPPTKPESFQTMFAVRMHCERCVENVSGALNAVPGVMNVQASLKDGLVSIEGTAPPSAIVDAIQSTGRDAILRGSGDSGNAAVSILETYRRADHAIADATRVEGDRQVRGLARMVQVNDTTTLVDLTVRGIAPGEYRASIRQFGDLKDGAASAGPVWTVNGRPRGTLCSLQVGPDGRGGIFTSHLFQIWEVVGHALVVTPQAESEGMSLANEENTVVGVIARSSGMWDNDKTVCSCTGKTLWEERQDEARKGMP